MSAIREDRDKRLSAPMLLTLHLAPGIAIAAVFFVLARILIRSGFTAYLALIVAIPLCLVPVEIGVMLWWARHSTRTRSLREVINYHQKGAMIENVGFPALLILWLGISSLAIAPVSRYIGPALSSWFPSWASQEALINGLSHCPVGQRHAALLLAIIFSGFVAPVVEELYFRGFLLSRMEHLKWAAPVMNSLLFALYHFYFPEKVLLIFVAFLPISYVVWKKRNVAISMITHAVINLLGVAQLFLVLT